MRTSHKGSAKKSLVSALAAGSTILALVLAPVSAAYLFQTSVIAQGVRGGTQQGPQGGRGGQPDFSKEIAAATAAADLLAKFELPTSDALDAAQADLDTAQAAVDEIRASIEELNESMSDLEERSEIADAKKEMTALRSSLKTASKDVTKAKKAAKNAMKPFKNVKKAADKIRTALNKGRVPQDQIDGLTDLFADAMACTKPAASNAPQGLGPQGPQSFGGPMDNGGGFEDEGECSNITESLASAKAGIAEFITERTASQAEMSENMNQEQNFPSAKDLRKKSSNEQQDERTWMMPSTKDKNMEPNNMGQGNKGPNNMGSSNMGPNNMGPNNMGSSQGGNTFQPQQNFQPQGGNTFQPQQNFQPQGGNTFQPQQNFQPQGGNTFQPQQNFQPQQQQGQMLPPPPAGGNMPPPGGNLPPPPAGGNMPPPPPQN